MTGGGQRGGAEGSCGLARVWLVRASSERNEVAGGGGREETLGGWEA